MSRIETDIIFGKSETFDTLEALTIGFSMIEYSKNLQKLAQFAIITADPKYDPEIIRNFILDRFNYNIEIIGVSSYAQIANGYKSDWIAILIIYSDLLIAKASHSSKIEPRSGEANLFRQIEELLNTCKIESIAPGKTQGLFQESEQESLSSYKRLVFGFFPGRTIIPNAKWPNIPYDHEILVALKCHLGNRSPIFGMAAYGKPNQSPPWSFTTKGISKGCLALGVLHLGVNFGISGTSGFKQSKPNQVFQITQLEETTNIPSGIDKSHIVSSLSHEPALEKFPNAAQWPSQELNVDSWESIKTPVEALGWLDETGFFHIARPFAPPNTTITDEPAKPSKYSIGLMSSFPLGWGFNKVAAFPLDLLNAASEATEKALSNGPLCTDQVAFLLCFSCCARAKLSNDYGKAEVKALKKPIANEIPTFGGYGSGEITNSHIFGTVYQDWSIGVVLFSKNASHSINEKENSESVKMLRDDVDELLDPLSAVKTTEELITTSRQVLRKILETDRFSNHVTHFLVGIKKYKPSSLKKNETSILIAEPLNTQTISTHCNENYNCCLRKIFNSSIAESDNLDNIGISESDCSKSNICDSYMNSSQIQNRITTAIKVNDHLDIGLIIWCNDNDGSKRIAKRLSQRLRKIYAISLQRIDIVSDRLNFLLDVSHQLNKPIRTIKEEADFALDTPADMGDIPKDVEKSLVRMRSQANMCVRLIQDYTDALYDAMQTGEHYNATTLFKKEKSHGRDITKLIQDISNDLEEMKSDYKVSLSLNLQKSIMKIWWGEPLVMNIIQNLMENAIKYGAEGTESKVIGARHNNGCSIRFINAAPFLINIEDREKIFLRLYRTEKARNRPGAGIGLSLALTRARALGGNIDFLPQTISEYNYKTEFKLTLPYQKEHYHEQFGRS